MMEWLRDAAREHGEALLAEHPSAEELVRWVEAPGELTESRAAEIRAHVALCAECEEDVARVRAVGAPDPVGQPEPASARGTTSLGTWSRVRDWLRGPGLVPAFAIVAAIAWFAAPRESESPIVREIGRAVVLRPDVERGAAPTVLRRDEGPATLTFALPPTSSGPAKCAVEIRRADGTLMAATSDVAPFDEFGTYVISVEPTALPAGDYVLVAREGEDVFRFAFRVE
ncbi:MAG: hypothetical protein R3B81_03725 [bacterium]